MSTYLVIATVAVMVSLTVLGYLGRRLSLSDDDAADGLCRPDHLAPASAARCVECGG